ncbi:MAG: hypothetical protein ACP6IY_16630 [Promethearchaeia archaeon]
MDIKNFLFEEDFSSIQKIFLFYNIAHKSTIFTSLKRGWYTEKHLRLDCKKNFDLKFPKDKENKFNKLFDEIINNCLKNGINYLIDLSHKEALLIYTINEKKILDFIISKIKKLKPQSLNDLFKFLNKNLIEISLNYNIEYQGKNGDFFVSLGLLYKGMLYNGQKVLKNPNFYYFPVYYTDIREKLINYLEDKLIKFTKKSKELESKDLPKKPFDKKEKVYKLKVISKGKKDKKAIKIRVQRFEVGVEFGGQDLKTVEIKCGRCGKSDKFIIENLQEILLRCGKCNSLNQPIGRDKEILKKSLE